jgi:amino acid transporter
MTSYARRLGLFSGSMAVIRGIIGGGIFRTPAVVAERLGSPAAILAAWVLGGVIALAGALCFGELGRRRPRAGGGYACVLVSSVAANPRNALIGTGLLGIGVPVYAWWARTREPA